MVLKLINKLLSKLIELNRITKQLIMVFFDSILVVFVLLSAFSLRLGYWYWPKEEMYYVIEFWIIFAAPVIAIPVFISFGLYRSIIRYIGFKSIWTVVQAVTLYAVIWGLITYMIKLPGIPRSAILINWMLAFIVIGGWRILARWYLVGDIEKKKKKKVIIYGAGSAGRQLSTTISTTSEFTLVGFVDDSELIQGHHINGVKVFPSSIIEGLVEKNKIDEILLAIPSLTRSRRNEILTILSQMMIPVRSMPNLIELAQGNVKVEDLREIDIKDLLGRDSIPADKKLLNLRVSGKVVLVTGAGGSIGSELCRQLLLLKPKRLILYDINEYSLYQINSELEDINNGDVEFFPILGSVRDRHRLSQLCQYFDVQTIYHAAAYKHVPLVEHNNSEGVLNNIIGTLITAEAAIENKVETFAFVSTDKAVRPTNTMGATKRVAELVLQALAKKKHDTCFTMVRFGNVLDSSGSVIPLFKKQIKSGGPVTVTDINIVRYFMTETEAVELVIQAGAMSNGGDVFVLDMGKPIRIDDLARKMIELSGLTVLDEDRPDGDIEIQYTGLRPGEKLYEELLVNEKANNTDNPLIMSTEEAMLDWEELEPILEQLKVASKSSDHFMIRELLLKLVPEFRPQCGIEDHLYKDKT